MYTPAHFRVADPAVAYRFMLAHPFGLVVSIADGVPSLSHVPFQVDADRGAIRWHLAAANPQADQLARAPAATLVFLGPHAYVSPSCYTAPSVPTWNYAAVHVTGEARLLPPPAAAALLAEMSRDYEGPLGLGAFEQSDQYARLLHGIRAFELIVDAISAKFKLSQNRSVSDRRRIADVLLASDDDQARMLGTMVRDTLD